MKINGHKVHPSLTPERVLRAAEGQMYGDENPGFCLACGAERDGCEPDAEEYECEECHEFQVYGACRIMEEFA